MKQLTMEFLRLTIVPYLVSYLCSATSLAQEATKHVPKGHEPDLYYNVQTRLTYMNDFGSPRTGVPNNGLAIMPLAASESTGSDGPRSLGLTALRLAGSWRAARTTTLNLVLRPDALTPRSNDATKTAREFDSRAGDLYRNAATVEFLDAYQLAYQPGPSFEFATGVWERLVPDNMSYHPLLAFGLTAALPEKFAAAKVKWHNGSVPDTPAGPAGRSLQLEALVYQGHEDRDEHWGQSVRSLDSAPSSEDAYLGSALALDWRLLPDFDFLGTIGNTDTAVTDGRVRGLFLQFGHRQFARNLVIPTKISSDFRMIEEKWSLAQGPVPKLVQQSLSVTGSALMFLDTWATVGAHVGKSERHSTSTSEAKDLVTGWQVDLGVTRQLSEGLALQLMLAHERRQLKKAGEDGTTGGFGSGDSDHPKVQRIGLELHYEIDKNS